MKVSRLLEIDQIFATITERTSIVMNFKKSTFTRSQVRNIFQMVEKCRTKAERNMLLTKLESRPVGRPEYPVNKRDLQAAINYAAQQNINSSMTRMLNATVTRYNTTSIVGQMYNMRLAKLKKMVQDKVVVIPPRKLVTK